MGILHRHIIFCLQAITYYFTTSTGIFLDGHFINTFQGHPDLNDIRFPLPGSSSIPLHLPLWCDDL